MKNLKNIILFMIVIASFIDTYSDIERNSNRFSSNQTQLTASNTTLYPVQIDIKFVYKKVVKGAFVTRHQNKSMTLAAGGSTTEEDNLKTTDRIIYPAPTKSSSYVEEVKITNLNNNEVFMDKRSRSKAFKPINITVIDNDGTPQAIYTTTR